MKLDYNFVQELLTKIEEIADGRTNFMFQWFYDTYPGVDHGVIFYHLKFLCDAGLCQEANGYIIDLTPKGREWLYSRKSQKY